MFIIQRKLCTKGNKSWEAETLSGQISRNWSGNGGITNGTRRDFLATYL